MNIRSVVHIATPNGGTPLADASYLGQFLSVATNAIGFIPDNPVTDVFGIVLDVLREWVLEPAGELPGVAAMKPGSSELHELNRGSQPGLVQRAVASSFEPGPNQGALRRLRDLVTDRVFVGVDNDLLVPTRSTYRRTDQFHIPVGRRLVLDTSFAVSHSQFWTEPQVTSVLERWLDPTADVNEADDVPAKLTDPAAELDDAMSTGNVDAMRRAISLLGSDKLGLISELVGGPLPARSRGSGPATKQGTVVVLPGVMGSRLTTTENGREVWFSPWHLLRGRFTDLSLDTDEPMEVEVTGMVRQYTPLLAQLDRSWDVLPFPYDWRRSIAQTARELAARLEAEGVDIGGDRPVHFVGHSMGGLVARAFLVEHHAEWAKGSGRFVQLGTPNWGSFAMPLACGERNDSFRRSHWGTSSTRRRRSSTRSRRSPASSSCSRHPHVSSPAPPPPSTRSSTRPRRGPSGPPQRSRPASPRRAHETNKTAGSTAWSMWPVTTRPRRTVSGSTPTRRSASA